jgi:hypothetical protein
MVAVPCVRNPGWRGLGECPSDAVDAQIEVHHVAARSPAEVDGAPCQACAVAQRGDELDRQVEESVARLAVRSSIP